MYEQITTFCFFFQERTEKKKTDGESPLLSHSYPGDTSKIHKIFGHDMITSIFTMKKTYCLLFFVSSQEEKSPSLTLSPLFEN